MKRVLVLFGHNLRREREKKNLSTEDLAKKSTLDVFTIRNLESGTKWPTLDAIENLADSLKVDPLKLFLVNDFEPNFVESLAGVPRDILNWLTSEAQANDFENIREYIRISREHRGQTSKS